MSIALKNGSDCKALTDFEIPSRLDFRSAILKELRWTNTSRLHCWRLMSTPKEVYLFLSQNFLPGMISRIRNRKILLLYFLCKKRLHKKCFSGLIRRKALFDYLLKTSTVGSALPNNRAFGHGWFGIFWLCQQQVTAFPWQKTMMLCFLQEKVHQKIKTGAETSGARGPGK